MRVDAAVVRPLRLRVLRIGGSAADAVWPGDDAPGAGHFAVRDGAAVVAVASVVPEAHPVEPRAGDWRLRGMATEDAFRGRGLGAELARACVAHAREQGAARVWLQARPAAVGLYSRAGFVTDSDVFQVPGLGPHIRMVFEL